MNELVTIVNKAHTIELRPTGNQLLVFSKSAGVARFTYNHLVNWNKEQQKFGLKYNRKMAQHECIRLRQSTPWMQEVSSRCVYEACEQFHRSMSNFFRTCKNKTGKKWKLPTFKRKFVDDAFRFPYHAQFSVVDKCLRIEKMAKPIRMRETLRFNGSVKSVSIRLRAGKWFATFIIETLEEQLLKNTAREPSVGVDFGLKSLAVLSTGEVITNPKPLRCKLRLLQRRQCQLSRKQRGSHRRVIASRNVARLYKKVADVRSQAQHRLTKSLVTRFNRIVIEDLNVNGMLQNKKLARSISDAGFGELRRQLEYKSKWHGVELVVADRFFPSSKTCSNCNGLREIHLGERVFVCPHCDLTIDRDLNAAKNLNQLGGDRLGRLLKRAQEPAEAGVDGANKALSNCQN
jgi:putative transposase